MNIKNLPLAIMFVTALFLLVQSFHELEIDAQTADNCILQPAGLGYPYRSERLYDPTPIPLPAEWESQINLSEFTRLPNIDFRELVSVEKNLWILTRDSQLISYDQTTKTITHFEDKELIIEGNKISFIYHLFGASNGELWALGEYSAFAEGNYPLPNITYLLKFNQAVGIWEAITNIQTSGVEGYSSKIVEDGYGNLWFIINSSLMKLETATENLERIIGKEEGYVFSSFSILIHPDGNIWSQIVYSKEVFEEQEIMHLGGYRLVRYDPITNELKDFGVPPEPNHQLPFRYILDSQGRIWANNFGWLEMDITDGRYLWYKAFPSNTFISDIDRGYDYQYVAYTAKPEFITGDRFLWYSSGAGIVTLDLTTGKWCLRNTSSTEAIVNDEFGNVWLADDGKLYKFSANP